MEKTLNRKLHQYTACPSVKGHFCSQFPAVCNLALNKAARQSSALQYVEATGATYLIANNSVDGEDQELFSMFKQDTDSVATRAANRGGAPHASYDKRRHRNFFYSFRHDHCKHFQESKHLLRSEVSWCNQTRVDVELHWSTCSASRISTETEPFLRSGFTAALNLDILDAGRSQNADSPPRDHLIAMVKLKKKT